MSKINPNSILKFIYNDSSPISSNYNNSYHNSISDIRLSFQNKSIEFMPIGYERTVG